MKLLIVGLGSMGKRRIRNLQHLRAGQLLGYDPRQDRRDEAQAAYGIRTYASFEDAMAEQPDALIISTPPELHLPYARIAADAGRHFFTEVGVGTADVDELLRLMDGKTSIAAPSCTLRFHPIVQTIKRLVEQGAVGAIVSFSSHSGQYLPDWHPWEDYRSFWASKRATGACREQFVLEAIWLFWVLGPLQAVGCLKAKLTSLQTDIDDVYQLVLRLQSGALGHMMLDVISRVPFRTGRLFGEQGVLEWSFTEKRVRVFVAADKRWQEYLEPESHTASGYIHAEHMYIREMEHFLQAIRGEGAWMFPLTEERKVQEALEAAEQSAATGAVVELQPMEVRP